MIGNLGFGFLNFHVFGKISRLDELGLLLITIAT
jgi:hypothetical protein